MNSLDKKGISPVKSLAAIVFGVVYIVVLLLIGKFPIVLPIALSFLIILAEREYTALVANKGIKTERLSLLFFSLLFVWSEYYFFGSFGIRHSQNSYIVIFLSLLNFFGLLPFLILLFIPLILFLKTREVPDFMAISATFFGIIYIGYLFSFFIKLSHVDTFFPSGFRGISGVYLLWLMTILTWSADVGGYIFGKLLKGPKFIPAISPGKTWSGIFGGIVMCITTFLVFVNLEMGIDNNRISKLFQTPSLLILAPVIIYIFALAGDLFESAMKRYFGVKDTGGLIPEHGGILDRFDSMLFVAPIMFLLILLFSIT